MAIEYTIDHNLGPNEGTALVIPANIFRPSVWFDRRLSYDSRRSTKDDTIYNDVESSTHYPRTLLLSCKDKGDIYSGLKVPAQNKIPFARCASSYLQVRENWTKQNASATELYVLPIMGSIKLEIPRDDSITMAEVKHFLGGFLGCFFKEDPESPGQAVWDDEFLRAFLRNNQRYFG